MFKRLQSFAPQILAITRVLVGISLATHGAQKLLGAFGGIPEGVPAFIVWTAGPIELVGGALMAVGLLTRPVSFLVSGLMAFAYFLGHAGKGFWPILNGGELAMVLSWFSLYLAAQGPGAWALDNLRSGQGVGLSRRDQGVPAA
jgi:putative oxidoreductase